MQDPVALYLIAFGGLLLAAVLLDDLADRVKLPGILLVLALGLLVDNDIRGGSEPLLSLVRANNITQAALVLVLFFGGLTTNWSRMKAVVQSAARLATAGVLITAGLISLFVIGMLQLEGRWDPGLTAKVLFIGAMLSSTDASAALSLLRPLAGRMPQKVLDLIEVESTINDPMAVGCWPVWPWPVVRGLPRRCWSPMSFVNSSWGVCSASSAAASSPSCSWAAVR